MDRVFLRSINGLKHLSSYSDDESDKAIVDEDEKLSLSIFYNNNYIKEKIYFL